MADAEILEYLKRHNFEVEAQDCIAKVLNTSRQIINRDYDFDTGMMTLTTPDNSFVFKWILGRPYQGGI